MVMTQLREHMHASFQASNIFALLCWPVKPSWGRFCGLSASQQDIATCAGYEQGRKGRGYLFIGAQEPADTEHQLDTLNMLCLLLLLLLLQEMPFKDTVDFPDEKQVSAKSTQHKGP
jgi:hypothetical protein